VLAQAADTEPQWVVADLHMALISDIREQGAVLNKRDWTKQFAIDLSET